MRQKLKTRIVKHLIMIAALVMALEVVVFFIVQINNAERRIITNADVMFQQIETVLDENVEELEQVRAEYGDSCLSTADAIAYILDYNSEAAEDINELRRIAEMLQVDEIHLFSQEGEIFSGTHPEYYGYSMHDGEQIGFFLPMLDDKTLRLTQDVTPNTAEGKMMQYSAVWNRSGTMIIQVGMNAEAVIRATEKNELNYIFNLLYGGNGVSLYAIDIESDTIVGASNPEYNGMRPETIGLDSDAMTPDRIGRHKKINNVSRYCVATDIASWRICYVVTDESMYQNLSKNAMYLLIGLLVVTILLVIMVTAFFDRFVIKSIQDINRELKEISDGALDHEINISGSEEFVELSSRINEMVRSVLKSTENISYTLNQIDLPVGVYEYRLNRHHVHVTDRVSDLLGLAENDTDIYKDYHAFEAYMNTLKQNALPDEDNLYCINGTEPRYLRLEERREGNDVLGVVIDMTSEILMRRRIESERDIDILTGVNNRRGLKSHIVELFGKPAELKHGVICMIDADGLKDVNDSCGHPAGDAYLQKIAKMLSEFGTKQNVTGRLGGDEFVTFLYGYDSEEEVNAEIERFKALQGSEQIAIDGYRTVPVRFSAGYVKTFGKDDHHKLMLMADEAMYQNKMERKRNDTCCRPEDTHH